jgi:hypothetical protein
MTYDITAAVKSFLTSQNYLILSQRTAESLPPPYGITSRSSSTMTNVLNAMLPIDLPSTGIPMLLTAVALVVVYHTSIAIYNATLHPLAKVPGYKLAGMTKLYKLFWCYHNGRSVYYRKIREMHDQLGPVVRVSPNEISQTSQTKIAICSGGRDACSLARLWASSELHSDITW